jgi:hypothetical protein
VLPQIQVAVTVLLDGKAPFPSDYDAKTGAVSAASRWRWATMPAHRVTVHGPGRLRQHRPGLRATSTGTGAAQFHRYGRTSGRQRMWTG